MHIVIVSAVNTGISPNITFGAVGIQGATVMGMHGAGVGTPKAAAVNAMTMGFAGLVHIAKGATFTIGAIAIILAPGKQSVIVIEMGRTINVEGAIPNEHIVNAPIDTVGPAIFYYPFSYRVSWMRQLEQALILSDIDRVIVF